MNQVIGIIGSIILLLASSFHYSKKSIKKYLFTLGNLCMFAYALFNFIDGGSIFFIYLQILINFSSLLLWLNMNDKYDQPLILGLGGLLTYLALDINLDFLTLLFVIGIITLALGFSTDTKKPTHNIFLFAGSMLIAIFSFYHKDLIFFTLNLFFSIFSLKNLYQEFYKIKS